MEKPFIAADVSLPELTCKGIVLACILAVILAAANAYIGLKVGLTVSASIPAAVIAMVVFRFAKQSNILENNLVQTGASASAAIASGIVFVIPALLIMQAWNRINYWETVFICLAGGILGVLFSIPLRRAFLAQRELRFPEGRAIAEVLKANEKSASLKELFVGGIVGAVIQISQQGFRMLADAYQTWFATKTSLWGLGFGFDVSLIGAGYIVGFNVGVSILLGAIIGWVIGVPIITHLQGVPASIGNTTDYVMGIWSTKIRYIGIGALLVGGAWSLFLSLKPIVASLKLSFSTQTLAAAGKTITFPRTEIDVPVKFVMVLVVLILAGLGIYLYQKLAFTQLGLDPTGDVIFFIITLLYIVFFGFVFSAIAAYFSGLVGVSASPVSAINIATLIVIALVLANLLSFTGTNAENTRFVLNAAALSILITAIIANAITMANNTIQDLKTGALVGATPWKLQVMLIIGVAVSTLIIPPVVELLFDAYGIGGVFPHAGMDPATALGAPQAALIAAVSKGIFFGNLPLHLLFIGGGISAGLIVVNTFLKKFGKRLSIIGCALAIYLPMTVTVPLIIGGLIAFLVEHKNKPLRGPNSKQQRQRASENRHRVMLIACGLVAGGSITGLLLSVPFAVEGSTTVFSLVPANFTPIAALLSVCVTSGLCYWMYRSGTQG